MEAPLLITLPHSICKPCEYLMDALGNDIPKDLKIVEGEKPENLKVIAENNAFVEIDGDLYVGAPLLITTDGRHIKGVQKILEELKRE